MRPLDRYELSLERAGPAPAPLHSDASVVITQWMGDCVEAVEAMHCVGGSGTQTVAVGTAAGSAGMLLLNALSTVKTASTRICTEVYHDVLILWPCRGRNRLCRRSESEYRGARGR